MADIVVGITLKADGSGLIGALKLSKQEVDKFVAASKGAGLPAAAGFNTMGRAVQQAGFQVGDFAVQVASGQNVLRAFIQQGTQFISMFGPWGAVIGAAGAIVGVVVTQLGLFDEEVEETAGAQGRLTRAQLEGMDAAERYKTAVEKSNAVLLTAKELTEQSARAKIQEAIDIAKASAAIELETVARLARLRVQREELENTRGFAAAAASRSALSDDDLDHFMKSAQARANALQQLIERLGHPEELGILQGTGREKQAELIDAEVNSITQLIAKMREEVELLGLSKRAREEEIAVRQAQDAAMKEGNLLTEKQIADVRTLTREKQGLVQAEADAAEAGRLYERTLRRQNAAVDTLGNAMSGLGRIGSGLFRGLTSGADSFSDALENLGDRLLDLANDLAFSFLSGALEGFDWPALLGITNGSVMSRAVGADVFHEGGISGQGRRSRQLPAAAFAAAPRFHQGMFGPDEFPAILRRGEGVFTPEQMRGLGGGGVQINVIDQRKGGERPEVQERSGPDGLRIFEIFIRDKVKGMVAGGELDGVMAGAFGLRRAGASR